MHHSVGNGHAMGITVVTMTKQTRFRKDSEPLTNSQSQYCVISLVLPRFWKPHLLSFVCVVGLLGNLALSERTRRLGVRYALSARYPFSCKPAGSPCRCWLGAACFERLSFKVRVESIVLSPGKLPSTTKKPVECGLGIREPLCSTTFRPGCHCSLIARVVLSCKKRNLVSNGGRSRWRVLQPFLFHFLLFPHFSSGECHPLCSDSDSRIP